eukprot:6184964-Pleurochrysis_carterae.AAC.1
MHALAARACCTRFMQVVYSLPQAEPHARTLRSRLRLLHLQYAMAVSHRLKLESEIVAEGACQG